MDIHKYVIDRDEGKAVARIEANVATTLTLDPSLVLSAARESRMIEAEWGVNEREVRERILCDPDITREEGCRMAEPLRIVSSRPEKYELYPSEVDIMYENGGGI